MKLLAAFMLGIPLAAIIGAGLGTLSAVFPTAAVIVFAGIITITAIYRRVSIQKDKQ